MSTLQIQDAFQPYYAGRQTSGQVSLAEQRRKVRPQADNTQSVVKPDDIAERAKDA